MKTNVAFGKTGLTLNLPDGPQYDVIHARPVGAVADVAKALDAALDAPLGCAPLAELAKGKKTAAISICDITRPAPNRITLPPLLERLHRAGLKREDIFLCIATGLHRIATDAELEEILGTEIAASYPIVNHDANNSGEHSYVGATARGTPIYVETAFVEADLHITLGFIEQHLMLGFSGGRKMIAPGLAGQQTIKVIHSPGFMRESLAVECSIEENPLHAELLEIARRVRHDFILDVTLTQEREISGVFAGEPVAAHAAGVHFLRSSSIAYRPEFYDAAITSAAGHPLDLTFYQTIKGISAVQHIVRPGGPILAVSSCAEGIGSPEFERMVSGYRGAQSFLDAIKGTPVVQDQWQLEKLALVGLRHPLLFYTPGADPAGLGSLGEGAFATIDAAVEALVERLGPNARIAIIPDGPYACVRVAETRVAA
jgi:nickel-dependent lactate racemase